MSERSEHVAKQPPEPPHEAPLERSYEEMYPLATEVATDAAIDTFQRGDLYDRMSSLRWRNLIIPAFIPAAVCGEAVIASGQANPVAVGAGAVGVVASWALTKLRDRATVKALYADEMRERPGPETMCWRTGQRLELIRTKTENFPQIEAIWYGIDSSNWYLEIGKDDRPIIKGLPQSEQLRAVVDTTREAGIDMLHVTAQAVMQLPDHVRPHITGQTRSLSRLHWSKKRVALSDQRTIVSMTTDEWGAVLDDQAPEVAQQEIIQPSDTLQALGRKLAATQPEHPLASLLTTLELPDDMSDTAQPNIVRTAARVAVERRLERTELYPEVVTQRLRDGARVQKDDAMMLERGRLTHDGGAVRWHSKYGPVEQDVLSAVGLGMAAGSVPDVYGLENSLAAKQLAERTFAKILNYSDEEARRDTTRTAIALEVAIMRVCHGLEIPFAALEQTETVDKPVEARVTSGSPLQGRIHRSREPLLPQRLLQAGAVLVGSALFAGVSYLVHERAEAYESQAVRQATATLATQRDTSPSLVPEVDAKDYAYQHNGFLRKWNYVNKADGLIDTTWSELFPDAPVVTPEGPSRYIAGINDDSFGVGNVIHDDDATEYELTAYNGANTAGFWASDTSHELRIVKFEDAGEMTPEWVVGRDNLVGGIAQVPPAELPPTYQSRPVIKVHRYLKARIQYNESSADLGDADGNAYFGVGMISIPVMEGTVPVAASLDGKKVRLFKKPDNTYAVQTLDGKAAAGKLDFWLAPDPDAPRVRALSPIKITGHSELLGPRTAKMVEGWKTALPDDHGATANRIEQTWKYTFTPFPIRTNGWKSFDAFKDQATDLRKANCNVANTIANIYNPRENATFGYLNHAGSKSDVLSITELHQRMTHYDATPSVRAEGSEPTVIVIPDLPYGWMAASAGILLGRRRIQRAAAATGRQAIAMVDDQIDNYKERRFAGTDRADYVTTLALSELVFYAGETPRADSLAEAIARIDAQHQYPGTALVERRQYGADVLDPALKALAWSTAVDAGVRNAARTSQTVLRAVAGKRQLVDDYRTFAGLVQRIRTVRHGTKS